MSYVEILPSDKVITLLLDFFVGLIGSGASARKKSDRDSNTMSYSMSYTMSYSNTMS